MALNSSLSRLIVRSLNRNGQQMRAMSGEVGMIKPVPFHGNRDVVGFGMNGGPFYFDRIDFPFPAIRFKENTPDVVSLREKEAGDWSKLTIEEKKALYRASFCQTFAEMEAPTGVWKSILGRVLAMCSSTIWVYMLLKTFVYTEFPSSFSDEAQAAQLQRIIDIQGNPIQGMASKYDYEKGDWK